MNELETAWIAGLLEGEGAFMLSRNLVKNREGRVYLYPKIVINMTDRDIIQRVCTLWQTKLYELPMYRDDRKPAYRAHKTGAPAVEVMKAIYPHMGERRKAKIDEILSEWDARPNANLTRSETMKRYRASLKDQMS